MARPLTLPNFVARSYKVCHSFRIENVLTLVYTPTEGKTDQSSHFSDFLDSVTDNVNGKTVNDESPHTMRR